MMHFTLLFDHDSVSQRVVIHPEGAEHGLCACRYFHLAPRQAKRAFEREYWIRQLQQSGGCVKAAALATGINRTWLHKRLKQLQVPYDNRKHLGSWGDLTQ